MINQEVEKYSLSQNYSEEEALRFFEKRSGWTAKLIDATDVQLRTTDLGAALECSDGRFDHCPNREKYGPRVFGGSNALLATLYGGDEEGYVIAARKLASMGYSLGTHSAEHGGCGFFDAWEDGRLKSAIFPVEFKPENGPKGKFIRDLMKAFGGKHFRLNGEHQEEGVILNPFVDTTVVGRGGDRFITDDWALASLGLPQRHRMLKIAEVVELLKPDAMNIEIIKTPR